MTWFFICLQSKRHGLMANIKVCSDMPRPQKNTLQKMMIPSNTWILFIEGFPTSLPRFFQYIYTLARYSATSKYLTYFTVYIIHIASEF